MRILNSFRFVLRTQRPLVQMSPLHIFQPLVTESCAELLEIDFNLHKTNSSYFSDVDISRSHLLCTLFASGIDKMRGGSAIISGGKQPLFGVALGTVSCNFHREIKPYQRYEIWSNIIAWDEKWVYINTNFVSHSQAGRHDSSLYPSAQDPRLSSLLSTMRKNSEDENIVYATAVSKCVFKSGRKTISPADMLGMSGLLPARVGEQSPENNNDILNIIEDRRVKGLRAVQSYDTDFRGLAKKMTRDEKQPILGRHTDGNGLFGVVCTLLHLTGLMEAKVL